MTYEERLARLKGQKVDRMTNRSSIDPQYANGYTTGNYVIGGTWSTGTTTTMVSPGGMVSPGSTHYLTTTDPAETEKRIAELEATVEKLVNLVSSQDRTIGRMAERVEELSDMLDDLS